MDKVECVVIGAGVIGLAVARRLAQAGREVIILEAAEGIGTVTSSGNSEVIHAGIYYPAGSLMARMCVSGKRALYEYCADHGIPHRNCGKLIVATTPKETLRLQSIRTHAEANGVLDLQTLSGDAARALEPALNCDAALLSPSTGIIDSHAFMLALRGDAEAAGAACAFHTPLLHARAAADRIELDAGGSAPISLECRLLINAAGLAAPAVARSIDGMPIDLIPPAYLAKGNYFSCSARAPFTHRIDQVCKRRPRAATEIVSLRKIGRRYQVDRHAVDAARDRGCGQAGGIDEKPAFKADRRAAAGIEFDSIRCGPGVQQRRVKGTCRAGSFGVAAQRQHEGVAVDNAGGRREQGGVAVQRRLQCARGIAGEGLQIEHAVGFGVSPDRLQPQGFLRRCCDDQLAAIAMRNAVIRTVFIEGTLTADAHPRHQAAGRIIDAGVDHFAVARRGNGADTFGRFQNDHLAAGLCQPPGDGKTDHPRTDDDALNFVHSQFGSGLVFYPTRRAPQGVGAFGFNLIPTLSLCLAWSFLQDRLDPFAGVFRAGGLLVKH